MMMDSEEEFFEVDKIIDSKIDEATGKYRYRIRWKGFGPEHDTWEPKKNLSLCLDLLKTYKEEKKREKARKNKQSVPPVPIKTEPVSEDERQNQQENDESSDNDGEEEGEEEEENTPLYLEGLTRSQKKQVLEVIEKSKHDAFSPTSSTPSSHQSFFEQDVQSDSSEIPKQKKRRKKKVMLDDTTSEEDDDVNEQNDLNQETVNNDRKKKPSDIIGDLFQSEKKKKDKAKEKTATPVDKPTSPDPRVPTGSKAKKVTSPAPYKPLVDQLQEQEQMNNSKSPEPKKKLKKPAENIQYEEKSKKSSNSSDKDPKSNLKSGNIEKKRQFNEPPKSTSNDQTKDRSLIERVLTSRSSDIKSKLQNLQKYANKQLIVSGTPLSPKSPKSPPVSRSTDVNKQGASTSTITTKQIQSKPAEVTKQTPSKPAESAKKMPQKSAESTQKMPTKSAESAKQIPAKSVESSNKIPSKSTNTEKQISDNSQTSKVNKPETQTPSAKAKKPDKTGSTASKTSKSNSPAVAEPPTKVKKVVSSKLSKENKQATTVSKTSKPVPDKSSSKVNKQIAIPPSTIASSNVPRSPSVKNFSDTADYPSVVAKVIKPPVSQAAVSTNIMSAVLDGLELGKSSQKFPERTLTRQTSLPTTVEMETESDSSIDAFPTSSLTSLPTSSVTSLPTPSSPMSTTSPAPTTSQAKTLKRSISETPSTFGSNSGSTKDKISSNKKEKSSRRLSIKEYQAKKQRQSSSDEMFIEFTPIPSSNLIAKAAGPIRSSQSLDNATIIPPKPTEIRSRTNSVEGNQTSHSSSKVPQEQLATSTDVLGNILQSINPATSLQTQSASARGNERTASNDVQMSSENEDFIIEEGDNDSQSSDFETDLEECSSDDEEFLMEPIIRTSHLEKPGANTIHMEHILVNQRICKGDVESVITCKIQENMINEYVDEEDTLLMKAVMECAPEMVQIMLEKGANPNVPSKNGKYPLMTAVEFRQKKLVKLLLQYGAHLNMQTSDGNSALDLACISGSIEIVHLLLLHGVDVKPTMESLNKPPRSRRLQVPQHLQSVLLSALTIHFEKLTEIVTRTMDAVKSSRTQLGKCLMPVRCLSPREYAGIGHTLYFDAMEFNVTEKHQNMILVAIPVIFERNGQIRVVYDTKNNGVTDVILNPGPSEKTSNVQAIEGSNFMHILFPSIPSYNELLIRTDENSPYKILVSVYTITYGRQTVVPHHRSVPDTNSQPVNTPLSVR